MTCKLAAAAVYWLMWELHSSACVLEPQVLLLKWYISLLKPATLHEFCLMALDS